MVFPFLGFPELWENLYIIALGFVIGISVLFLRYKSGLVTDVDEETSLHDYVKELQERFKEQVHGHTESPHHTPSRISDVQVNDHE